MYSWKHQTCDLTYDSDEEEERRCDVSDVVGSHRCSTHTLPHRAFRPVHPQLSAVLETQRCVHIQLICVSVVL